MTNGNGNGRGNLPPNGNGNGSSQSQSVRMLNPSDNNELAQTHPSLISEKFDQPVILRQSPLWSRSIVWGIVAVTTFAVGWAFVAEIEEAVPAQGKLEPKGAVKEVQPPIGGLVKEVSVEEGQWVEKDQVLLTFDQTAAQSQLASLNKIRESLAAENQFYRSQLNNGSASANSNVKIPPEMASLSQNRAALLEENELYRAILNGGTSPSSLNLAQRERFQTSLTDLNSRIAAAELEIEKLNRQLRQTRVQLANAKEVLAVNQRILNDITPLAEQGGLARVQLLRQQQEVGTREAEVENLVQEELRLESAIAQAREQLQTTIASGRDSLLTRIGENEKRLAEIESQITKVIVDNDKRIQEIDSQVSETSVRLDYQALRAPVSGVVFDLNAYPGYVAVMSGASDPILKLVPSEGLVARVFITNKDIGFVDEGMRVDVRIDSFPYSEFGDITGTLVRIGDDALPPDEIYQYYRFPAEIELDKQFLTLKDTERQLSLQSGMSVSANIRVRERRVIDIFINLFSDKIDSLKTVR
ncbi:MAG: HlyD family efflux transporter periplasmic adaptor subunit [Cyanobacteriota bacterium]